MNRCHAVACLILLATVLPGRADPSSGLAARTLTRDECVRHALDHSLELQMQALQLASASADVVAVSAVYDPALQLGAAWDDSELPPGSFPTSGGVERGLAQARLERTYARGTTLGVELDLQRNLFEGLGPDNEPDYRTAAGLTLRQSLWRNAFGSTDRLRIDAARQQLEVAVMDYEQRREDIAAATLDLYWRAVEARQVADTQAAVVERLRQLLETNRRYVEDGLLDESAVLAVEASLAVAEVDALTLRYQAEQRDEELKDLIRLPSVAWDATVILYELPEADDPTPVPTWSEALEDALRYRADVEALRRDEQRAEAIVRLNEQEDRGDLELTGSLGRGDADASFGETFDFDKNVWSVGITYAAALGNSQARAAILQALVQRDQVRIARAKLESDLERNARAAVRQVDTAARLVPASERAFDAQSRKLDLERVRFERGQSDTQTLLDFEDDRDLAERDLIRARVARERARLALDQVRGQLLPETEP
jgi:outer membrane protein TolC